MNTRAIPKLHGELITLAQIAARGAELHGEEVGLLQNTGVRIRQDLAAVTGESDAEADPGRQHELNTARSGLVGAQKIRRAAMADGRAFCAAAVDLLKIRLGRRWNPRWLAAGFTHHSIAIPHDPSAMLVDLRNYFRANPEHENAPLEIGAERADALATALQAATQNVLAGRTDRKTARRNRDTALRKLAVRLRGLRSELDQLLAPDDPLWFTFGFSRPADRRQPAAVEKVEVQMVAPGMVVVSWPPAVRAEDYRVSWRREGDEGPLTEVGRFAERTAMLENLPSGVGVIIEVTARNRAGETLPTRGRVVVG